MNSSSSFAPERDSDRSNGYDSDGIFNGAAATSAAHHSSYGEASPALAQLCVSPVGLVAGLETDSIVQGMALPHLQLCLDF